MTISFNKLLENKFISDYLTKTVGEGGIEVLKILFKAKKFVSEFALAEMSGIYVNTLRSLMYKLYEHKIVSYSRQKEKSRGWYIYSWRFNPSKLVEYIIKTLKKEKEGLKEKLSQLKENYFYCKKCKAKFSFSEAMEYDFECPQCATNLEMATPKKERESIKRQIKKIDKEIEGLQKLKEETDKIVLEEARPEEEIEEYKFEKQTYFCTKCEKPHKINSKIGKEHRKYEKKD